MVGCTSPEHAEKIGRALHEKFVDSLDRNLLARAVVMYEKGATIEQVAAAIGKPRVTTYRWLKLAGAAMRPRGRLRKGKPWSAARRVAEISKVKKGT